MEKCSSSKSKLSRRSNMSCHITYMLFISYLWYNWSFSRTSTFHAVVSYWYEIWKKIINISDNVTWNCYDISSKCSYFLTTWGRNNYFQFLNIQCRPYCQLLTFKTTDQNCNIGDSITMKFSQILQFYIMETDRIFKPV